MAQEIYNLPESSTSQFPRERVAKVYNVSPYDLLEVNHEEYGIKIGGFLLHPKQLGSASKFLIPFVNQRPVEDKGIFRAVQQGISEFVLDFYKPSAVISINLASDQVDVNVAPSQNRGKAY